MTKIFKQILLLIAVAVMLISCLNLRYTDYGKPFDFLKAKNNYHVSKHTKSDTASIFQSDLVEEKNNLIQFDSSGVQRVLVQCNEIDNAVEVSDALVHQVLEKEVSTTSVKTDFQYERKRLTPRYGKSISFQTPEKYSDRNKLRPKSQNERGDGWKFILKWLLIGLLIFVAFVGVIIGLYYLLLWLGGAVVAIVVLTLILVALEVFWDIDLFWIFNLI